MSIPKLFKATVLMVSTVFIIAGAAHGALAFRNASEGQPTPGFSLKDMAGNTVSLSDFAGKVVVVVFFKPDQDNSVAALADLQKLQPRLSPKGVVTLAIISETDEKAKLKEVMDAQKITFPVLLDEGRKAYGAWGVFLYPTTGVIDKDGKLAAQVPSHNRKYAETVEGNARLALGEITKEQLAEALNPKEKEQMSPERKKAERHMMLAGKLIERKLYDKAAEELSNAVAADPDMAEARVRYGFILLKLGDPVKAQENFTKAVEIDPKVDDAKTGLGACYVAQQEVDKGIEVLTDALKLNTKPARAYFELGRAYEKKGAFDKASEHYRKALEALGQDW
jgi:tetratricopeptide (TPR) repeat protein